MSENASTARPSLQHAIANTGAQRDVVRVDPFEAGLVAADIHGEQPRLVADRQVQRVAHHCRLRAHGGGARKGQRPRQFQVVDVRAREARLLRGQVPVVVEGKAESRDHGVAGGCCTCAGGRAAARLRAAHPLDPAFIHELPADDVVHQLALLRRVHLVALQLHLAAGQREMDGAVAHAAQCLEGHGLGFLRMVVAGGAVLLVQRLAGMVFSRRKNWRDDSLRTPATQCAE